MKLFPKLILTFRHSVKLAELCKNYPYVEDLTAESVKELGCEAVILDHDGVVGPSFSALPDETGRKLIAMLTKAFPGKVFIFTNSKRTKAYREKAYAESFPELVFIKAERKPSLVGLHFASEHSKTPVEKIAVIDDGLMTGVLMAIAGGAKPVYALRRKLDETPFATTVRLLTTLPQVIIARLFAIIRRIF